MAEAYIVDALRTPGARETELSLPSILHLGDKMIDALPERPQVGPTRIDEGGGIANVTIVEAL